MNYKELSRQELIEILQSLKELLDGLNSNKKKKFFSRPSLAQRNDLESLIGTIPFLLHNRQVFEKNQDIADFAKRLNINIPAPDKKKREDLIGRIVSAIAEFDNQKIKELNKAIESIKKTDIKRGKLNFFSDWEKVIKDMKIS